MGIEYINSYSHAQIHKAIPAHACEASPALLNIWIQRVFRLILQPLHCKFQIGLYKYDLLFLLTSMSKGLGTSQWEDTHIKASYLALYPDKGAANLRLELVAKGGRTVALGQPGLALLPNICSSTHLVTTDT